MKLKQINDATCHPKHKRRLLDISLDGEFSNLPDAPPVPKDLSQRFKMWIYDHLPYAGTESFCTGDDGVSLSISEQGVWEAFDTLIFLDVLTRADSGLVIDFGSQLGWYSILGALMGYKIQAYDVLAENIEVMMDSAKLNGVDKLITPNHGWVDEDAPILPIQNIRFFKSDIEGNEQYAFRMYQESFQAKTIDYASFEVSPAFNGSYPELVHKIMDCGYKAYKVPEKRWEHTDEFAQDPLETTLKYSVIEDVDALIRSVDQVYILFVRDNL